MASTAASHFGASLSYTELGPPDKIIPAGSSLRISSSAVVHGNIALNTCCSRTRRAINWVYCPPKSSTTTPPCSVFIFPCSIPRPALCSVPCFIFAAPSIPSPHSPPAVSGAPPSFCEGGSWVLFSSSLPLFLSSSLLLFLFASLLLLLPLCPLRSSSPFLPFAGAPSFAPFAKGGSWGSLLCFLLCEPQRPLRQRSPRFSRGVIFLCPS